MPQQPRPFIAPHNLPVATPPAFRKGDHVQFTLGGPEMIVMGEPNNGEVSCLWFDLVGAFHKKDIPVFVLKVWTLDADKGKKDKKSNK
jgi:uncharacterized protein YodC (DUF2158 family)